MCVVRYIVFVSQKSATEQFSRPAIKHMRVNIELMRLLDMGRLVPITTLLRSGYSLRYFGCSGRNDETLRSENDPELIYDLL